MILEPRLQKQVDQHPYPLVFATISGAHLYGFPSADSDYDCGASTCCRWPKSLA